MFSCLAAGPRVAGGHHGDEVLERLVSLDVRSGPVGGPGSSMQVARHADVELSAARCGCRRRDARKLRDGGRSRDGGRRGNGLAAVGETASGARVSRPCQETGAGANVRCGRPAGWCRACGRSGAAAPRRCRSRTAGRSPRCSRRSARASPGHARRAAAITQRGGRRAGLRAEPPGEGPLATSNARAARSGTVSSSSRFSTIQASSGASVSASHGSGVSTYCAWPPSRCGGTTIRRAMAVAAAAPSSRRTRCRHASMPAAVPALVITAVVVDVEDRRGRPGPPGTAGQLVGVHPVRGAPAAVEQPGLAEREGAAADAQHPAPRVRARRAARRARPRAPGRCRRTPGTMTRSTSRVASRPCSTTIEKPAAVGDRARARCRRRVKSNAGPPVSRRSMPKTSHATPELEGRDVRQDDDGDGSEHAASIRTRWRNVNGQRQFCHSWRAYRRAQTFCHDHLLDRPRTRRRRLAARPPRRRAASRRPGQQPSRPPRTPTGRTPPPDLPSHPYRSA